MDNKFSNSFSEETWYQKYKFGKDDCVQDTWRRVAKDLASIETDSGEWEEQFYQALDDFKFVPGGRITSNAGTGLKGTTYINCFHGSTEIVTRQGIFPIQNLVDKEVMLLGRSGKWSNGHIKYFGKQEIVKLTVKKNKTEKVILTTAGHKWFAYSKAKTVPVEYTTMELRPFHRLEEAVSKSHKSTTPSPIGIAQGFTYGDGSTTPTNCTGNVNLCDKKDLSLIPFFDGCKYHTYDNIKQIVGIPNSWRELPSLNENISFLLGWLAGYFAADGCVSDDGECTIASCDKGNIEFVKSLCSILGIRYFKTKKQARISNLTNNKSTIYSLCFDSKDLNESFFVIEEHKKRFLDNQRSKKYHWKVVSVERTGIVDDVYCAVVPVTHKFTLADNILTSNCFVHGFEDEDKDSIEGIYKALLRQAQILKSEGGYGFCADVMRPNGSHIKGIANQSPGAVRFLELWDKSSEIITAGSNKKTREDQKNFIRKGAQMVTMSCWHPDVVEFIEAKKTPGRLSKFNMSVLCTDEFMRAVEQDQPWELLFPNYEAYPETYKKHWNGNIQDWIEWCEFNSESKEEATITYHQFKSARDLWNLIMENTYNRNEPGVLFVDTMNRMNNLYYCEWINATNPSLRSGTYVLTNEGPKQIQKLENNTFQVVNLNGTTSKASCKLSGKNQKLYKITLNSGFEYFCTKEHRWATSRGELTTLELTSGDRLPIQKRKNVFNGNLGDEDDGFLLGWILGDGWITTRSDNGQKQVGLIVSEKDFDSGIADKLERILKEKTNFNGSFNKRTRDGSIWYEINTQNKSIINYLSRFDFGGKESGISDTIFEQGSGDLIRGLLNGYLSSDGYVQDAITPRINFVSKNKKLLLDMSEVLGFFGIRTKLRSSKTKCKPNQFPNKKIYSREYTRHDLIICDKDSLKHFATIFNSDIKSKQESLSRLASWNRSKGSAIDYNTILSIEETDIYEDVWDITVYDNDNCFSLSHCITHNCGEQVLPKGGVCLLGSINLVHFIDPDKKDWKYEELKNTIHQAIRFMDNVNDKTHVPLESQKENLKNKRRIGLGLLGYGSALLMARLRYGSGQALKLTEKLMHFFTNEAYKASALLAKEKGHFPLFDQEKYLASEFVKRLDKETIALIKKYGIRNSHVTSIQPTGNSSCFANLVSGGLEPLFMHGYVRTSIQPVSPDGMWLPINVDWGNKKFELKAPEGWDGQSRDEDWKWVKEGDEDLLATEFEGKVWKYDRTRGLLKEEWIEDYGVSYLKRENKWDAQADWAACTMNLGVDAHVNTMSIFAKWVDSAISKTINLPHDYSYENFKDVYHKAWENGIKGFTTYREGTMTAVLSSGSTLKDEENKVPKTHAPDRPKELPCDVHHIKVKGAEYFVLVGLYNDDPYEIFAGKNGFIDKKVKSGTVIKLGRPKGVYKAILEDGLELSPINATCNEEEDALTRMASTALRHGADIHMIVAQLEKVKGDMHSFAKSMARALKKYIPDGSKEDGDCPSCNKSECLLRQEGCIVCSQCGWSGCN